MWAAHRLPKHRNRHKRTTPHTWQPCSHFRCLLLLGPLTALSLRSELPPGSLGPFHRARKQPRQVSAAVSSTVLHRRGRALSLLGTMKSGREEGRSTPTHRYRSSWAPAPHGEWSSTHRIHKCSRYVGVCMWAMQASSRSSF